MKKALCLLLALVTVTGLSACGSKKLTIAPATEATLPTGDVGVNPDALEAKYQKALRLLVEDPTSWDGTKMLLASQMQQAYELFGELKEYGYKDAEEYFTRFTVIPDVLLYDVLYETDENGEATLVLDSTRGYHYAPDGQLICRADDLLDAAYYYHYDADGSITETHQYIAGQLSETVSYTYAGELLVKEERKIGDVTESSCDYTYDEQSNLVKKYHHGKDNADRETVLSYDAAGKLLQDVCTLVDAGITFTTVYTYDENGVLIQTVMEKAVEGNPDANVSITTVYTYSGDRIVTETSTTQSTPESGSRIYVYGDYYCYASAE